MGKKASTNARSGKDCTLYKVVKELFPNKGKKAIDEMVEAIKEKVSGLSKADAEKALKGILPDISDQDISIIINDIIGEKISKKPKVKFHNWLMNYTEGTRAAKLEMIG